MNTGKLQIGSYCLARNAGESRWYVQFKLPEGNRFRESSKLKQCERCRAEARPLETRPNCVCQRDVKAWAVVRLDELALKWKNGRLEESKSKVKPLTLGEVVKVYGERGPACKKESLESLELVVSVSLGRFGDALWATEVEELTPDLWRAFAWCYQEFERRGLTDRTVDTFAGLRERVQKEFAATVDGGGRMMRMSKGSQIYKRLWKEARMKLWKEIRKAMPARPDPDTDAVTQGNTTIISHMRKAKAVLGKESRDSYLWPVRDRIPAVIYDEIKGWWACSLQLPTPDNRFSLSAEVYAKMWKELPALKQDDPQAWALVRLHWTTGIRPIEASQANESWLQTDGANVLLVVKNRFEDDRMVDGKLVLGFRMKDAQTRQERPWPLPTDLVEMLPRLVASNGNLLGCETAYQWDRVYRRANAWLRSMGVEGSQTLYHLRKLVGTVKRQTEGLEAAADALGHASTRTSETFYTGAASSIKALSDEDLSPEAVMGAQRQPWKLERAVPVAA